MNPEVTLTQEQRQRILGILIGDGFVSKARHSIGGSQIVLRHSTKQLEYLKYKIHLLENIGIRMSEPKKWTTKLANGKTYSVYQSQSNFLKCLERIRRMLYPYGKKTIRTSIVQNMTCENLAILVLDDGSIQQSSSSGVPKYSGIRIATDCFSIPEHEVLIKHLRKRFGIVANINYKKQKPYLYIGIIDSFRLVAICKEVLMKIPSLAYKWRAFYINSTETRVLSNSESLSDREIVTRLFLLHILQPNMDRNLNREVILKYYASIENFNRALRISKARLRVEDMTH